MFSNRVNIFSIVCLVLAIFLSACSVFSDDNYATTAELSESNLIEIPSFTVDESVITKGESIILDWSVNDEDPTYDIDYVTITPNVGNVAQSGSEQVTPTASTTYTLAVYVKGTISGEAVTGELARARMLQIIVLDAAGVEIEEEPEAEVCNDGEDNDRDILTDCDDDDCAEDSACADVEVTYGFTSYSVSPDAPEIGEEVTLSWESNCDLVTSDGFSGTKSGTDSYTFTIESDTKEIALYCYVAGGLKGSEKILVTATEPVTPDEPEFNARLSFKANPSTELIYGMPFCLDWSVQDASEVYFKDPNVADYEKLSCTGGSCGGSECYDEANETHAGTYYLKVVDTQGLDNGNGKAVTITVNQFDRGTSSGMSELIDRIPGIADGEYYFISASKIYHTTDYGVTTPAFSVSGLEGEYKSMAVDTEGNLYVGTSEGLFMATVDTTIFTRIYNAYGFSINAIYPRSTESILIGDDEMLLEVFPESRGCEYDGTTIEITNGYCFLFYNFGDRDSFGEYNSNPLKVYKFIAKRGGSSKVVIITNDGTFYSDDGGDNFDTEIDPITNGIWLDSDNAYFWYNKNDHADYEDAQESHGIWYYEDGDFKELGQESFVKNIKDVFTIDGKIFVATENGIFYKYNDEWLQSDLGSNVNYLMGYKSFESYTYSLFGFDSDGNKYELDWDLSMVFLQTDSIVLGTPLSF